MPSAVTTEPDRVRAQLREELIPYFSLPFYRAMIELSGFEEDVAGFDKGMSDGGPEAAVAAISDEFLGLLAAIGTAEEATESCAATADCGASYAGGRRGVEDGLRRHARCAGEQLGLSRSSRVGRMRAAR